MQKRNREKRFRFCNSVCLSDHEEIPDQGDHAQHQEGGGQKDQERGEDQGQGIVLFQLIGQVFIPGLIGPAIGAFVLRNAAEIVNSDGTVSFLPDANIFLAALVVLVLLFAVLFALRNSRRDA